MEKLFKVKLQKDAEGKWYWKLISSGNNEVLSRSESYESFQGCLHTANFLAENLSSAELVIDEAEKIR